MTTSWAGQENAGSASKLIGIFESLDFVPTAPRAMTVGDAMNTDAHFATNPKE